MKKLALALVCLVSVAFFASCDPTNIDHPEPTIALITGTDYITGTADNPQTISYSDPTNWRYGFHVESNAETKKELASLKIVATQTYEGSTSSFDTIIDLTGKTSYDFSEYVYEQEDSKEIFYEMVMNATVTDVDGQTNTASIAFKIDQPAVDLEPEAFEWVRNGGGTITGTGLAPFGLKWESNLREIYAVIEPMPNAQLFILQPEDWDNIVTDLDKAAFFSELTYGVNQFKAVSCTAPSQDYDLVIGTIYEGECYLMHIEHSTAVNNPPLGTKVTITGEWK